MANFNKVYLIGNLTRDPELRVTPKGTAICQFGLAVNRQSPDLGGSSRGTPAKSRMSSVPTGPHA